MFNNISARYDLLNHLLSFGIDILWRKKCIKTLGAVSPKYILDVATGTGDLAIAALRINPEKVIAVDISDKMLAIAIEKITKKKLDGKIEVLRADAEQLPFEDNSFDGVTVAFGVRNFSNLTKGLSEMHRVLNPNGMAVILEFSRPQTILIKQLYNFYFMKIVPLIGRIISGNGEAYQYLPDTVKQFPCGNDFLTLLKQIGFKNTKYTALHGGIAMLYVGTK